MVPGYVSSWIKEEVEERNTFWIKRRKGRRNGAGRAGGVRKRKDNGEWWRRRIKRWGKEEEREWRVMEEEDKRIGGGIGIVEENEGHTGYF